MTDSQKINQIYIVTVLVPLIIFAISAFLVLSGKGKVVSNSMPFE